MATTDDVIKEELGKLGGGELGLSGLGAQLVADRMPSNVYTVAFQVRATADAACEAIALGAANVGRVIGGDPSRPRAAVRAVIRAGFWNLNPTVVEVEVSDAPEGQSRITLTGTAKEGLVKQRSGQKAVERLIAVVPLLKERGTRTILPGPDDQ
jgi:hypothetical protein